LSRRIDRLIDIGHFGAAIHYLEGQESLVLRIRMMRAASRQPSWLQPVTIWPFWRKSMISTVC
jgi:hypothetical protein